MCWPQTGLVWHLLPPVHGDPSVAVQVLQLLNRLARIIAIAVDNLRNNSFDLVKEEKLILSAVTLGHVQAVAVCNFGEHEAPGFQMLLLVDDKVEVKH